MAWQTLNIHTLTSVMLITTGAVIIGVSIFKMQGLFRVTPLIAERSQRYVVRSLKINRCMMLFFVAGYIVVATSVFLGMGSIGILSMSLIFLCGAVFVFLGLALHSRMIDEIQHTIQGLLPICMECKKIRMDGGDSGNQQAWKEIESYISQRTDARFSHGICPECLDKVRQRRR